MIRNAILALAVSAVLFGSAGEASAFWCKKKKKACPVATTSYVVAQPACGCGSSGVGFPGAYATPGYYGSTYGNSYPIAGYAQPGYPSSGYGGSMGYPRAGGFYPNYR